MELYVPQSLMIRIECTVVADGRVTTISVTDVRAKHHTICHSQTIHICPQCTDIWRLPHLPPDPDFAPEAWTFTSPHLPPQTQTFGPSSAGHGHLPSAPGAWTFPPVYGHLSSGPKHLPRVVHGHSLLSLSSVWTFASLHGHFPLAQTPHIYRPYQDICFP